MISTQLIQDSLREGWSAFKIRPWPIISMMAGLGALWVILQASVASIFGEKSWQSNFIGIISQFLFVIFYPGFQAYMLKAVRREGPDWMDFFWGWKHPVRVFVADILSSLPLLVAILVGGLALGLVNVLGVPDSLMFVKYATFGVLGAALVWVLGYFGIRLNQWSLLLIDKNVTALESVKQSWALMRGQTMNFFVLLVIAALINCLGALALFVGIFISIPFSLGAFAAFYVKVSQGKLTSQGGLKSDNNENPQKIPKKSLHFPKNLT